ncbi:hypothetical protein BGZ46_000641, partial [Entomortierella lignicola]
NYVKTRIKPIIREFLRDSIKGRLLYHRNYELDYPEPALVEASFTRISKPKSREEKEYTVIDELIAFRAVINCFEKYDLGFFDLLKRELENDTPLGSHGTYLEFFSPSSLIPAFHEKTLRR